MATSLSSKIDAFIADQQPWQQVILREVRELTHKVDPAIVENWRWGCPHFDHDGIMFGIMSFKKHMNLFFHKGALVADPNGSFADAGEEKGSRSVKIKEGDQLDKKAIAALIKSAIEVNESGIKLNTAKPKKKAIPTPREFATLLKADKVAWGHWEKFPPSYKKEYNEWIVAAKRTETRERRMKKALDLIHKGTGLHDMYK